MGTQLEVLLWSISYNSSKPFTTVEEEGLEGCIVNSLFVLSIVPNSFDDS